MVPQISMEAAAWCGESIVAANLNVEDVRASMRTKRP